MMLLERNTARRNREFSEIKNLIKQEWGEGLGDETEKTSESLKKKQIIGNKKNSKKNCENIRGTSSGHATSK